MWLGWPSAIRRRFATSFSSFRHGLLAELAAKFNRLVDALNDVSEMSWRHSDRDVLRLYEVWLKTGSPRAHGLLRELGVSPTVVPVGRSPN